MHISSKPTIYIIDALNFIRSYLQVPYEQEEEVIANMIDYLQNLADTSLFGSTFRVIIDGSFRPVGITKTKNVDALFSEEYIADKIIAEQATFLKMANERVCVITSDRELRESLQEENIKVLSCSKFFKTFLK